MKFSATIIAAFAGLAAATPVQTSPIQKSMTAGVPIPLTTEGRVLPRATALPTCDPKNVAIVESQQTTSSKFCSSWRSAGTVHSAPVTVTGLANWQISNICSCILTGTYVANPPLSTTSTKTSSTSKPSTTSSSSTKKTSTTSSSTKATSSTTSTSSKKISTSTSSSASAVATTYEEIVIAHHNVHRTNHSASALTWSASQAATALEIANSCVYAHNTTANGGGYGQNIAAGVPSTNISAVITDLFYNNEVNNYPLPYGVQSPNMTNFENWGHFSQIVWMSTTQVGCATVDCSASGLANVGSDVAPYFTVCNYYPPGNYLGEFGTGVGASIGEQSVQWNYDL